MSNVRWPPISCTNTKLYTFINLSPIQSPRESLQPCRVYIILKTCMRTVAFFPPCNASMNFLSKPSLFDLATTQQSLFRLPTECMHGFSVTYFTQNLTPDASWPAAKAWGSEPPHPRPVVSRRQMERTAAQGASC